MPLIPADDARPFAMHGVTFSSYAASATGARALAAWRADFAPLTPGAPHRMDREEVLLVLQGELSIEVDDDAFVARSGDAVLVPAESRFCVSNDSNRPATLWATTSLGMTAEVEGAPERLRPPWAQ